jgi:hypothetical protein
MLAGCSVNKKFARTFLFSSQLVRRDCPGLLRDCRSLQIMTLQGKHVRSEMHYRHWVGK